MGFFRHDEPGRTAKGVKLGAPTLALLYKDHFDGVLGSVRCFGVPERDGPDVAHDVFIRVQASLPRYDPARPVGPWLKTITYRTAQDYLRSAHVRHTRLARTEEGMDTVDTAAGPERRTLLSEAQRVFVEVLQELNEDQRTIYLMSVKDGFSIPELAEALGENENTVRSRLHRAHQAFDAALARRRTVEERRDPAIAPMLVPAALAEGARNGLGIDPAVKALVWSRLSRLLGLGIIGALAPVSGAAIAGGAALLMALGGGVGAALHATLERPARTEAIARAEPPARAVESAASPGGPPSAMASASAPQTTTASTAEADAGVQDAGPPDAAALLRAEQAILAKARGAMNGEQYEAALRELNRHERLYPRGMLAEQRKDMKRVVLAELAGRDGGSR
jgi:RNA polymerase sigma-70 factor, ECF subfamily